MGRFFEVASPEYVNDIVYQAPWELMKEALAAHDTRIGEQEKTLEDSDGLLAELNNLQGDNPEVNKAIQSYRDNINSITSDLQGNYADYGKQEPSINNLKRKLQQDMDNGLLGRAQEQYNSREEEFKRLDGIKSADPKKVAAIKKFYDLNYQDRGNLGFKDKDNYNEFVNESINPVDKFNEAKFLNDLRANINADITASASAGPGGGYIWTKNNTKKFVNKERVSEIMKDHPSLRDWEADTKQDIMLKGNNELGLRGEQLNAYVDEELARSKDEYLNTALNQLVYTQEGAKKGVSVDGLNMAKFNRSNQLEDRDGGVLNVELDKDTRSGDERKFDASYFPKIKNKLKPDMIESLGLPENYTSRDFVQAFSSAPIRLKRQLRQSITSAQPGDTVRGKRVSGMTMANFNTYMGVNSKVATSIPLFEDLPTDYENGVLTPDAKIRRQATRKAMFTKLKDRSIDDQTQVDISDVDGDNRVPLKSRGDYAKLKDMAIKANVFNPDFGNTTEQITLSKPKTFSQNGVNYYMDESGKALLDENKEFISDLEKAQVQAAKKGTSLATVEKKKSITLNGKKFNVLGITKPDRRQSLTGDDTIQVDYRLSDPTTGQIRVLSSKIKTKELRVR